MTTTDATVGAALASAAPAWTTTGLRARKTWVRLHQDEQGLEVLQVVALLAIAAIVLMVLKWAWYDIKAWFRRSVDYVLNWQG